MRFVKHKKVNPTPLCVEPPNDLATKHGYYIEPLTVISVVNRMIIRVKVRLPYSADENMEIHAKTDCGEDITMRSVFLGRSEDSRKINGTKIFKNLTFSVFVPYPEQNLVLEVRGAEDKKVFHQQLISGETIALLRAIKDSSLYEFAVEDPHYTEWLTKVHRPSDYELQLQRQVKFSFEPLFSIVVPLYKTPISFFNDLLESIENQTYPNWELIFVNASPEEAELANAVELVCKANKRIKAVKLQKNEGITLNTAHGIEVAKGDFVCFVDHDDTLEPNCLFEYAQRINERPNAELLYCDEDLFKPDGTYAAPFCKPEFNLYLLRSDNYVCHMLTIKRELLMQLEYNNSLYDGAQDHHLTLQAAEKAQRVEHISKVLYHWRVSETSVCGGGEKPYAVKAGLDAVSAHLERVGVQAKVTSHKTAEYTTSINYALPTSLPKVSIIIPLNNNADHLEKCLMSVLEKTTYDNYEIILVPDSVSFSAACDYCKSFEGKGNLQVVKFEDEPNYSKQINFGQKNATGDYLLVMDGRVEVKTASWIEDMLGICCQPEVGAVGCKLLYHDDTIHSAGVFVGNEPYRLFSDLPNGAICYHNFAKIVRELSVVSAECMMIDAKVFGAVGGFCEEMTSELAGVDFCFKIKELNNRIVYAPCAEVYCNTLPLENCSCLPFDKELAIKDAGILKSKWTQKFNEADPNFTPNFPQGWRGAYYSLRD